MDSAQKVSSQSEPSEIFSRAHPAAARVLRRWRELAGGLEARDHDRRTLIACSGGADSMALAAIIALVTPKPVIAHIIHDLRPHETTRLDRDAVAHIANEMGCVFVERSIRVADQPGNTEHNARAARYRVLTEIASEHDCRYIATGHHADDQLETMLMNISRGCGPRGLAGIQDSRVFQGITIIRPMLCITHQDAQVLCSLAGVRFIHDFTNDDLSLTRNRLRHTLLPVMRQLDPEIATRASSAADSCRSTVHALNRLVRDHLWTLATHNQDSISWTRDQLRNQPDAALVELFRISIEQLALAESSSLGVVGHDRMTQQSITDAIRAITDSSTNPRTCRLGPIVIGVTAHQITMSNSTG